MNFKDLIIPFGLALLTTWAIQHFFLGRYTKEQSDEISFVATPAKQVGKPLNTEVDFIDAKRPAKATITPIDTSWASLEFSTDGASLESLAFKRNIQGKIRLLPTIFAPVEREKEKRCFLVGLNERTPYFYQLVDKKVGDETVNLVYQAQNEKLQIKKTFSIYQNKHQVDVTVEVIARAAENIGEVRIFYPAPFMPALADDELISALIIQRNGSFEKINRNSVNPEKGWYEPQVFGADNRYFIHALVGDPQNFAQRAYYNVTGKDSLTSILETFPINQQKKWTLSFYLGPKEAHAIDAVDARLEQTLDYYGWFAPISKILLNILNWLYGYLHNYGLAIIVLTILIKLVLLPFTLRSERSLRSQGEVQKKLAYLEKKYKDDPQVLARERAEFMKKHGLPGLGGCLPLLVQIPIFFALSRVLSNSIELYQAPMLWISNLSAKDPYYILPALVVIAMLFQSTLSDPKQRMFGVAMALVFGAITASLSAGLALYIGISTVLTVAQSAILKLVSKRQA